MELKYAGVKSRINSWKVKEGFFLPLGHVLFSYMELDESGGGSQVKRFKSIQSGVISKILVKHGGEIDNGTTLLTLVDCPHPTVMRDMCAECGMDLRKLDEKSNPTAGLVSMVHSVPDLRISVEQAQVIGKGDEDRLLKQKKLVLLVDLDQTIIHTTNDQVPVNIKDVFHFQLSFSGLQHSMWYHTRLRPETLGFLDRISKLYELHICTFGTRSYAHAIARHLDPCGKFFGDRILSRDECFSQNSKTANLKELFPRGDHMVCIIDDREDVWNFAANLIHVKPYHFFRHTGDINAPPGLTKQDEDDKSGVSFDKNGGVNLESVSDVSGGEELSGGQGEDIKEGNCDEVSGGMEEGLDELPVVVLSEAPVVVPEPPPPIVTEAATKPSLVEVDVDVDPPPPVSEPPPQILPPIVTDASAKGSMLEIEDSDDYLLYLEQILRSIHEAYYSLHADSIPNSNSVPDVKNVIPYVRKKVLKNVSIVFSGVVPTEVPLADRPKTRPYRLATSLGAQISEKIIPQNKPSSSSELPTTHIIAARLGTAKVNEARRYKGIQIVTPDWLYSCAERWEKVDENLYGHNRKYKGSKYSRVKNGEGQPMVRKERTPSGRFMDSINPLLSFSMDEIESMGHEVDDICNESESSSEEEIVSERIRRRLSRSSDIGCHGDIVMGESSDSDSNSNRDHPQKKRKKDETTENETTEDEPLSSRFRRGADLPSEIDYLNLLPGTTDSDANEEEEEEMWMARELEREFLHIDDSQE